MSAASPPPSSPPVPAPPPASPATVPPAAPPPRPRTGEVHDEGAVRRDSVDADRWVARGTVKVTGDVRVGSAQLGGTVSVGGKLTAGAVRSHGAFEVDGAVEVTGLLASSGNLRAESTVHAREGDLRGESHVAGALSVDRMLTVRGSLIAPSLAVGGLDLEGTAEVPGEVVALTVTAHFTNRSALGTVRAPSVRLRARVPNLVEKVFGREMAVTVRRVEAETAELEGVDVTFVRAPKIILGRDAHLTEYEGTIVKRHPSSRVGFESRSPRPYGLRR